MPFLARLLGYPTMDLNRLFGVEFHQVLFQPLQCFLCPGGLHGSRWFFGRRDRALFHVEVVLRRRRTGRGSGGLGVAAQVVGRGKPGPRRHLSGCLRCEEDGRSQEGHAASGFGDGEDGGLGRL